MTTRIESEHMEHTLKQAVADLLIAGTGYGLYVPLFCATLHALCHSMSDASNKRVLICISITLFLLITSHWVLQALATFIELFVALGLYPPAYSIAIPVTTGQVALYVIAAILADAVFTYRLFVIWERRWPVVVLPIFCMFAVFVMMITLFYEFGTASTGLTALLATLITNVYITTMISFKIWRNNRAMASLGHPGITSIIRILLESAGLYTIFIALTIITSGVSWVSEHVILLRSTLTPLIGITYSLMIVLVAQGRTSDAMHRTAMTTLAFQRGTASQPIDILSSDETRCGPP